MKKREQRAEGILEERVILQEQAKTFLNFWLIFLYKCEVFNECYLLQNHLITRGVVPELSFHLNISAQHICWVMNFISAQSPYLSFEKTKKSQPNPQKRIYYMIFSLIILDKERLNRSILCDKRNWIWQFLCERLQNNQEVRCQKWR